MRWAAAALLAGALLLVQGTTAIGCDPDWEWCGYDWYEPYAFEQYVYDVPAYEEPSPWSGSVWWDEPAYEAPVTYQPSAYEPVVVYQPAYEPAPVYEPVVVYEPAPVYVPPVVLEPPSFTWVPDPAPVEAPPPVVWSSAAADVLEVWSAPAPEPAPVAIAPDPNVRLAELGLHSVTSVWTGDTVMTEGLVTTYSSSTVAMNAGTAARIVASVGTGEASGYDGLLFNGRMTLSDGRPVKGEIYANYVWNGYDWAFDKYVFFQDDLEIARLTSPPPPIAPPLAPSPLPVTAPPLASPPPTSTPIASPPPPPSAVPASVVPLTGDVPSTPDTAPSPASVQLGQPRPHDLRAGIALAPQGEPLGRVEVLRGRRVPLWVRATLDGAPATVAGWRLVHGELTALGPTTGAGDEPLVATWRSVTGPGSVYSILLRASVDAPGEGLRDVDASIDVVVRSPALVD